MVFNMKETTTPKGVWFSTVVMSTPLILGTGYLAMISPFAMNAQLVDPNQFAYIARTCIRMLSLNISFFGGIHYGLATAAFDTARSEQESSSINLQIAYSFVPAIAAFASSNFLLFSVPLTTNTVIVSFSSLLLTQFLTLKFDQHCVKNELAPVWFRKYRGQVFAIYAIITSALFFIYLNSLDQVQRTNDPNRIQNLKTVMELEDLDFIKMVEELKLDFNEVDLRDIEKQVKSKMRKVGSEESTSRY